jgi:hypothetical protein
MLARLPKFRGRMQRVGRRLSNQLVRGRRRIGLDRRDTGGLAWLFVATLPNSGSTALAGFLASAPRTVRLAPDGEGQWLLPDLDAAGRRWDPDLPVDFDLVRAVWIDEALKAGPGPRLVIEKSPPNLCRFRPLVAAFRGMPTTVLRFTRDPYAVCASWSRRYDAAGLARMWDPDLAGTLGDEARFYRALGRICGERMAMLADLADLADLDIAYETLTDRPAEALGALAAAVPLLAGADAAATVRVKNYAPQSLVNMNAAQVGKLSPAQLDRITEGLAPHAAAVEALGYALR